MRPLLLKVKGFTSFRDEQTIDFSDMDLFVLTGATGSGKSSVLDAVTYALFGKAERVGSQTSQLISQGQPRMAVTLDFSVGDAAYRITRTTTSKGTGTVLLERREGEDWVSLGEGAGSIREVNKIVPKLIGLDYDAFTRSVILPQGKFAEFLSGDAAERRAILSELLGLELFTRMSQHARLISSNAKAGYEAKGSVVTSTYAGIDTAATEEAEKILQEQSELRAAAEDIETKIGSLEQKWSSAKSVAVALRRCAHGAGTLSEDASTIAGELGDCSEEIGGAEKSYTRAHEAMASAREAAELAQQAATKGEEKLGPLATLNALVAKAESLEQLTDELQEAVAEVGRAEEEIMTRNAALEAADSAVGVAQGDVSVAEAALMAARAGHDKAHRADLVGAVTTGLKVGDPCPVCETPLERLPKADRKALQEAQRVFQEAEKKQKAAAEAIAMAERSKAVAEQADKTARETLERCRSGLLKKKSRLEKLEQELGAAVGPKVADPLAELSRRIDEIGDLQRMEIQARRTFDEAKSEEERQKIVLERANRAVFETTTRLKALPIAALLDQIAETEADVEPPAWPPEEFPDDPSNRAELAASLSKDLRRLADDLEASAAARDREMSQLVEDARAMLPNLPKTENLDELITEARRTAKQMVVAVTEAENHLRNLRERLAERKKLEKEIEEQRAEHVLYGALAKELMAKHIVAYLQAEALRSLATAGSRHLRDLSDERYILEYEGDNFYVVDAWNGHEKRSVKTLSGGETFLASLSLALALSEQVQYLSVSERGRLESLFLDEGFDTLDSEFLEVVVHGINQLSTEGRLVGVITHVQELAERIPVRLVVTKSPRGSTVRREDVPLIA